MQNAFAASGGVPKQHRTDSLSAAYRNLGSRSRNPQLIRMYEEVCAHYRLQATRNNLGIAPENGAIEASHGHFKRRLKQALLLRGSYNFETIESPDSLVIGRLKLALSKRIELHLFKQIELHLLIKQIIDSTLL